MKRALFVSVVAMFTAICFGNVASAQILNPRPLPGQHVYPRPHHPKHWHHDEQWRHDNGKHKGWDNPHNPHSGLKGYRKKD